jgi:hypothetical protein
MSPGETEKPRIIFNLYPMFVYSLSKYYSGPKVIELRMETSLKSQASDWLKWRLVSFKIDATINKIFNPRGYRLATVSG